MPPRANAGARPFIISAGSSSHACSRVTWDPFVKLKLLGSLEGEPPGEPRPHSNLDKLAGRLVLHPTALQQIALQKIDLKMNVPG